MNTGPGLQPTDIIQLAIEALRAAEMRMRDAAAKAAAVGEYDSVEVITRWAKTLLVLMAEVNLSATGESVAKSSQNSAILSANAKATKVRLHEGGGRRKRIPPGAPVYSRDGDFLVKSARSRKTQDEYEHRAPSEVIFAVADFLAEWRSTKKLLTADQLLEDYSKRKGRVTSYQVYVALGWLTQIGLVLRHSRSGYSVPSPSTISDDTQKAWAALESCQAA